MAPLRVRTTKIKSLFFTLARLFEKKKRNRKWSGNSNGISCVHVFMMQIGLEADKTAVINAPLYIKVKPLLRF